ncbi:TIGR00730 family Rossman fold protein [Clostridium sp. MSJ-8]|uniref:LOG family protein n=1 Tax=Clostridium sp. MSJ-8 TaxID=2841510 RepID=UPI001C0EFA61|nr:TIGR00730 family Rossman fold protein [Clostridium sp. MSJ-8]MBU5487837.1 TIGR00730 family Rossman fold protein [Clostridium sp. MSJ-8]
MKICVYGAAREEINEIYKIEAEALGRLIGERGHTLVFGGGRYGMMGAVARGVKEKCGHIIGVSPEYIQAKQSILEDCDEIFSPATLQDRKKMFEDISDAFIILPGGIGTCDELFEILAQKSLGQVNKKVCVLNINGYYNRIDEMLKYMMHEGFIKSDINALYKIFNNIDELLDYVEN